MSMQIPKNVWETLGTHTPNRILDYILENTLENAWKTPLNRHVVHPNVGIRNLNRILEYIMENTLENAWKTPLNRLLCGSKTLDSFESPIRRAYNERFAPGGKIRDTFPSVFQQSTPGKHLENAPGV